MPALTDVFGEVPKVAPWINQPLTDSQKKALGGNISNFGDIAKLGQQYTDYVTGQQNALLPGYSDTLAAGEKGAQQLLSTGEGFLSGKLPQDVIDATMRNSAYQNYQGGFAGSGMGSANQARNLGLTSLDLMSRGAQMIGQGGNSAQQWAQLASGDILNPQSMFITPQQQQASDMQNAILRQNYLQNKYNAAAAPSPAAAGISNTIMSLIGAYVGHGMGGGGGFAQAGQNQSGIGGLSDSTSLYGGSPDYGWYNSATGGMGG